MPADQGEPEISQNLNFFPRNGLEDEDGLGYRLEGKISEMCSIWQLRRNFVVLLVLLSSCSFCFFLINF